MGAQSGGFAGAGIGVSAPPLNTNCRTWRPAAHPPAIAHRCQPGARSREEAKPWRAESVRPHRRCESSRTDNGITSWWRGRGVASAAAVAAAAAAAATPATARGDLVPHKAQHGLRVRAGGGGEEEEEAEQEVIGGEYGDEEGGGAGYDDDVLEGFEDWHMDGELHDGDLEGDGAAGYDDGTWPAEQEGLPDLPELIFTEGCDDDGVDLGPCISLRRCSNGRLPVSGAGPSGDVDAVRVMLLGVSGE